jgi:hypothetical protein
MTTGQMNIWRYDVRRAMHEAVSERRAFSRLMTRTEQLISIRQQVLRATFCAKLDGFEFSKL